MSNNKEFVLNFLSETIKKNFQNLNTVQIQKFALEFFNNYEDWKAFKGSVRDLMICTR